MKNLIAFFFSLLLFASCSQQQSSGKDKLLALFNFSNTDNIFKQDTIINDKLISYDRIKKEITLLRLNDEQKLRSMSKILSDNYLYEAYLVGIQERVPNVFTVIIFINTDYVQPIYLLNYKDTALVDYIYHNGSYVYDVVRDTDDREIVYGYERWFEFHNDTVCQIEVEIQDYYYNSTGEQIEFQKDSTITKYIIEETGKFKKI